MFVSLSMLRMLEPSANAPITAICLSLLSTFAMSITVLHKLHLCQVFLCYNIMRMEFIAWLRKIQHALHECAESIRRTEQCKWNQEMMRADPSKPLDIRAVVSYDQQTVTDAATQDERNHTTQESIKNATWAAFYAVAAYAVITTFMWCAMMEQNKLARESIHQNERQWKAQQRPWVGLSGNVEFPKPPMLEVFAANGPNYTQIDLSV